MHRLPGRRECAGKPATRQFPLKRDSAGLPAHAEPRLQPRVTGRGRSSLVVCTFVFLVARALPAQAIGQGFELERAGQYDQAAAIYLATLRAEPTNLSALLGLERVLPPINRLGDLLPAAQRAAAASPSNVALRGVLLRTYVALNEPDSGRAVALRWAAAAPGDEAPYREWAMALEDAHRPGAARDVLLLGRRALGRAGAAAERGERVGRGARRAARAHRALAHRGDPVDAHAPARGRAPVELGTAAARVGRVRAERRHAVGGRGVRGPAFRRPCRRSQHARRPARARARARALRRPGARGGRGGRPGARRRGARFHRGRRSGRRARRARTGRAGLECTS